MSGLYIDGNAFVLASNAGHRTQSHNRNECNADPKHKSKGGKVCVCVCLCCRWGKYLADRWATQEEANGDEGNEAELVSLRRSLHLKVT